MLERYPYLSEDSLYRPSTEGFTKRTITPVMASLAELLKTKREYERHYEWFVDLARNFHTIQVGEGGKGTYPATPQKKTSFCVGET